MNIKFLWDLAIIVSDYYSWYYFGKLSLTTKQLISRLINIRYVEGYEKANQGIVKITFLIFQNFTN